MSIKHKIRSLVPAPVLSGYHYALAAVTAASFGLPASRLKVIGITGTKGKTSTSAMLWHILQNTGNKAGLISTAFFAVGEDTKINDIKMTMPGRATMQRLLRQMIKANCHYAVVETSSEGLVQWRHLGIPYVAAVFTNLAPEHIEAHGTFVNYREAKGRLARQIAHHGGTAVINLDDMEAEYFISQSGKHVWGYTFKNVCQDNIERCIAAEIIKTSSAQVEFKIDNLKVNIPVGGEFNAYNALAAMTVALELGIPLERSAAALASFAGTPGRLEFVQLKPFAVVVDYAHTPESLSALYTTLQERGRLIAVLGSCGGGRDKAKRMPLGKLAGQYADSVIITDEDPYDENPRSIMETVAEGVRESGKKEGENYWIIEDRRQAIQKALSMAKEGDTVVITGKGAEQWLMVAGNKKIPWDDREVVRKEIKNL
ncbi:MAG: hypothetical protein A2388_02775 [Candidatus Veblenbacteria bacterium RIFOXYB1_FULL_43_13]|uniref:UDP-N-acetylmuramyl-tripeptide synthetase n=1 Tax=Candidatus Veblenbacteria bacterium RIFOXYB1_FULL_43_13 TaxID=1802426 RepID=A0A1G2Q565_9BACT|nr:MAG: UDP-N-acetylmuramyl-tripeptide synthetase [Parcubacteria group bacterium GW2011_GWF1_43_9]OHA55710.1 MAG: hypothetical protein A2388_02775 [Candidatus Veblenbacteria bacterium RIFOXYB1_FULL_43_13]